MLEQYDLLWREVESKFISAKKQVIVEKQTVRKGVKNSGYSVE